MQGLLAAASGKFKPTWYACAGVHTENGEEENLPHRKQSQIVPAVAGNNWPGVREGSLALRMVLMGYCAMEVMQRM